MKKINLSVIGTGAIAESAHLPSLLSIPQVNLVSLCDIDEGRVSEMGARFNVGQLETDYTKVIEDPVVDAVVVATDASVHAEIVLKSLEMGKAVFVEKPITTSLEDAERIGKISQKMEIPVMVGYQLRFMPNHIKVKELLRKGVIGKIYLGHVRAETLVIKPEETLLIDYGTHFFDLIRWYFDDRKIAGVMGLVRFDKTGTQVGATALLRFEDNFQAAVEIFWVRNFNWSNVNRTIEFLGEKGKISTKMSVPEITLWQANSLRDKFFGEKTFMPKEAENAYMSIGDYAYKKELEVFIDCLLGKNTVPVSAEEGLVALKIADAVLKSHQQNREIMGIQ